MRTEPIPATDEGIARASERLREGDVVAFPTETVYGLGADARDEAAVRRVFEAKGRPAVNPLIVHVPDLDAAARHVVVDERARRLAAAFWPGPLTLVLPLRDGHGIAHPRRFGIACHGGLLFDVPSIGCAKSLLVGSHGQLGKKRGSTAEITIDDEVVGMAVRTRDGVKPVYVSPGHRMDLPTAVELVLRMGAGYREPETTRRSHALVNRMRREAEG